MPLHNCDFEGSKVVGDKLKAGLSLGLSKHWKKSLKELTGEDDLSADAILEYFEPLYKFLKSHNEKGTVPTNAEGEHLTQFVNILQNDKVKKVKDGVEHHFTLELHWDHF